MAPGKRISSRVSQNTSIVSAPSSTTNGHSIHINESLPTSDVSMNATKGAFSRIESSPTCENSSSTQIFTPDIEIIATASNSKNKRGPNRGVELEEFYRTKGKISIFIPEGLNRPVGEHHSKLPREAGIIIRNFAPMQVERWEQIHDFDKEMLIKKLMVKMNINIEQPHVKECVMHTLSRRFIDFRSKAHAYYKKLGGGNVARQKPFKELAERLEDWLWLCNYFDSDTFKKKSESNSQNRSKLKFVHRMGTRSLIAHQYDQKLSRIELYKEEFTDKEKKWASEECKTKYENMVEIRQKIIDEGGTPDETLICADVLGETSSYIRGLGYGPKPEKKTKFVRSNEPSAMEVLLENNLKDIEQKYNEQSKIIKSQQKTIEWLKTIAEKMGMQPPNDEGPDVSKDNSVEE